MHPLNEQQIRSSLVNTTRRETNQAVLPDLAQVSWARLDYLGWHDLKGPLESYVVLEVGNEEVGGEVTGGVVVGIALRAAPRSGVRRKGLCAWCQDIVSTAEVSMFVARRAGPLGRRGNTRRKADLRGLPLLAQRATHPLVEEVGSNDPDERARLVERWISGLRERASRFVADLRDQDHGHEQHPNTGRSTIRPRDGIAWGLPTAAKQGGLRDGGGGTIRPVDCATSGSSNGGVCCCLGREPRGVAGDRGGVGLDGWFLR